MALTQVQGGMLAGSTNTTTTIQSNGTTAITIDSSQNVGIGTASPVQKLQVNSTTNYASGSSNWDNGGTITPYYNGSAATDAGPSIGFVGNGVGFAAIKGAQASTNSGDGYLSFLTRSNSIGVFATERMRVASGGQVRIGMANYNAQPNGTNSGLELANTNNACVSFAGAPTTSTHWVFGSTNGVLGTIQTSSATCSYNNLSDYRQKENVAPMAGALAKVQALKPVTFTWKVDGSDGQGFIAHELQAVIPDAVTGEKDAVDDKGDPKYQMVDTSFLVATLTAAIQELKAEFDAYKASHP